MAPELIDRLTSALLEAIGPNDPFPKTEITYDRRGLRMIEIEATPDEHGPMCRATLHGHDISQQH